MSQPLPDDRHNHQSDRLPVAPPAEAALSPLCLQLMELIPQVIWLANAQGEVIHANHAWQHYTGAPTIAACGDRFLQVFHTDDRQRLTTTWQTAIALQQPMQEKARLRMADGTDEWFLVTAKPLPRPSTEVDAAVAWLGRMTRIASSSPSAQSLSDRHAVEAELRALNAELEARVTHRTQDLENTIQQLEQKTQQLAEQEAKFRSTFEQVAMGCAYVDLDGRWQRVNQKLCEIVGYSREELLSKTFQDITHPDDLTEDLHYVKQLLDGQINHYRLEKRYLHKDHSTVWVKITVSLQRQHQPLTGGLSKPLYFVAMIEDISERKQWELRDAENRDALEAAKATLEKRNYDLDQFVYIASHDLKAPLRGIKNLSEWLEEDLHGQLPPENQTQLGLLRQRVQRMERLIDGLLQYSRVGREQLQVESVDIRQLLLEVVDSVAPPPHFQIDIPSNMPTFKAKRILLSQVFANLLNNAIKHHDRATGYIEIKWQDQGSHYQFTVIDDGPGVAPTHHQRIFGVFQTLGNGEASANTGIGLALIKKIIESENGTIQVHSDGIRGCEFEFTWPTYSKQSA